MTHPENSPALSGNNIPEDEDDVILLTEEMSISEEDEIIDLSEIVNGPEIQENSEPLTLPENETDVIDLDHIIEETDVKPVSFMNISDFQTDILENSPSESISPLQDDGEESYPGNQSLLDDLKEDTWDDQKLTDISLDSLDFLPDVDLESDHPLPQADNDIKNSLNMPSFLDDLDGFDSGTPEVLKQDNSYSLSDLAQSSKEDDSLADLDNVFINSLSLIDEPFSEPVHSPAFQSGAEGHADDLQRLIDDVVQDDSSIPVSLAEIAAEADAPADMKLAEIPEIPVDSLSSLIDNRLDAVVESVVKDLYAERIEHILTEVITARVNREIENLKSILLDHLKSGQILK